MLAFPPFVPRGRFLIHNLLEHRYPNLDTVSVGLDKQRRTVVYQLKSFPKPIWWYVSLQNAGYCLRGGICQANVFILQRQC